MGIAEKRKVFIREALKGRDTVLVAELAKDLDVSEMTIRRDLSDLEHEGFLKRTHGGAVREAGRSYEPPFTVRETMNTGAKQLIAAAAAELVEEGDTIAIDSGTTAMEFARALRRMRGLTVVTPSIHIAFLFLSCPGIETILAGGRLRKKEGSLVGEITRRTFENLYFDKFFMSAAGLSTEAGYTEYILEDAAVKKLIIANSRKTIALMGSDKLGRTAFSQVCGTGDAGILVTDLEPKAEIKAALKQRGVKIIIPTNKGDRNEMA